MKKFVLKSITLVNFEKNVSQIRFEIYRLKLVYDLHSFIDLEVCLAA